MVAQHLFILHLASEGLRWITRSGQGAEDSGDKNGDQGLIEAEIVDGEPARAFLLRSDRQSQGAKAGT